MDDDSCVVFSALKPVRARGPMDHKTDPTTTELGTLMAYLRTFMNNVRQERIDERQLRREELEQRKKERTEDLAWRREEAETRKRERHEEAERRRDELTLERSRQVMEQQRWDADRKEKELYLEIFRRTQLPPS